MLIGDNCNIGKDVRIEGPTVIGPECRIEDAAIISGSILWGDVVIGYGCRVMSSIIAGGSRMQPGSEAERAVLGHNVTLSNGFKLEPGARVEPGKTLI